MTPLDLAPAKAGMDAARLERITDHLERNYIAPGKIAGCQVAVARHGHLAYTRSLGQMDRERARPMAEDAIFRLYSMTKPITAVALMTLYERGYFQLNDPVSKFFPEWKQQRLWISGSGAEMVTEKPPRPPSVRDMLCHTGGLTYGDSLVFLGTPVSHHPVDEVYREVGVGRDEGETLMGFMDKLARVPLLYAPGERWKYSLATDVCGALVEKISGQRYDRYLKEVIFDPLGMADTGYVVPPQKADRLCASYYRHLDRSLRLFDDPAQSPYLREPTFFGGGSGLAGTLHDYMRFCEMLRRGGELDGARILGPRTIDLIRRNHLKGGADLTQMAMDGFSETANEGAGFGLGFATTLDNVKAGVFGAGDFYWGGAASTIFSVDPVEDLTMIFLTQLLPSAWFDFRSQLKSIIYSSIVA